MATINIFNGLNKEHTTLHANGKIKDVLSNLNLSNFAAIKAGCKLEEDYELTESDVVFVRSIPHGATLTTIAIVSSVVALGVAVGVGLAANKRNQELQAELEKAQTTTQSIDKLPFVRGAKNQSAMGKTIPYVMGETYFAPYTLNNGFYTVEGSNGEKQFWNVPLTTGYKNQKIKSLSLGSIKLKDFDTSVYSQDGKYKLDNSVYGNIDFEMSTNNELQMDGLNQKVIGQYYGAEVKHDFGKNAEPVIEQLEYNAMRVQVCIRLDGLRKFNKDSGNYEPLAIKVVPYWTNNGGSTWNMFYFDVVNDGSSSYEEVILTETEKQTALTNGKIIEYTIKVQTGRSEYKDILAYRSNDSDYTVDFPANLVTTSGLKDWTVKHRERISGENTITRNTKETCRFVAAKTFSAEESYGKNIQIKVVKESVTAESNTNETVYLEYINTWCYDNVKSSSTELVACSPVENPFRDQTMRFGLKIEANGNTENILDEVNVITCGCARKWNGSSWNEYEEPTRNIAAWILDILTSPYHSSSQIYDTEINLQSFGALYEYCENNELYADGVVSEGVKKEDLVSSLLASCFSTLILDEDGKLSVVIDKKETSPIALINEQNIVSIDYAKTFQRSITGLKTTYTNSNDWTVATEYFFKDGHEIYDQTTDRLSELALEYVSTHNHAYKIAQRQMRQTILQPRTITVNVGLEGDCYPLYKTVLLQTARFKQGVLSTTIHDVIKTEGGLITGFELADTIEFVEGFKYGIIVQAQSNSGKGLIYSEITGTGKTNIVTLANSTVPPVDMEYGNIASIGLLNQDGSFDRVTNVMKIVGINPASNHGWELVLKDYNEEIYETGVIPEYKPNITKRPTTARTLPTMKPIDVDDARYSNWSETKQLVANLEQQIEQIETDTTVCDATVLSAVFDISDSGFTMTEQSVTTTISLRRSEVELDFTIGQLELPEGFSYSVDGKNLTITVGEGVRIKAGLIRIPVQYRQVLSADELIDSDGEAFIDSDGEAFVDVVMSDTYSEWNKYLNYSGSGLGVYLGKFTSLSDIPTITNVGDYFTWAGENRKTSDIVYGGFFLQAQVYKYIGNSKAWKWEIDNNSSHTQAALSDVLSIANADLEHNNSNVWLYLDHLTSNSVYADMIVSNKAFIEQLSAKIVTSELVKTEDLVAGKVSLDAYDFATKSEIPTVPQSNQLVKSVRTLYYKTTSKTQPSKPTASSQIVDTDTTNTWTSYDVQISASYYIYACTEETYYDNSVKWTDVYTHTKTIISGGYIRTGILESDVVRTSQLNATNAEITNIKSTYVKTTTLESNYASINYLKGGNAEFSGTITGSLIYATKGLTSKLLKGTNINDFKNQIKDLQVYYSEDQSLLINGSIGIIYQNAPYVFNMSSALRFGHSHYTYTVLHSMINTNISVEDVSIVVVYDNIGLSLNVYLVLGYVKDIASWESLSSVRTDISSVSTFKYTLHV